jgi:menaquinone-9 beta-reductase
MRPDGYDVVVVGASISGSATATLLAREGLRVALVEARADIEAFKRPCGHFIQSSATPAFRRLGVAAEIERAGGVRNSAVLWTRRGWIPPPEGDGSPPGEAAANASSTNGGAPHGYTIRREKLDPILRRRAAETDGVTLMLGATAREITHDTDGMTLEVETKGKRRRLRGRLLVAADGRNSAVAKIVDAPSRAFLNRRFMYLAYYRDTPLAFGQTGQVWFLEPDIAYAYPTDEGLTLMLCSLSKDRLDEFKSDREGSFRRVFERAPRAPEPDPAKRVTPFIGKLDMTNRYRAATLGRIAFVGDAAITPDASWAVGCGWGLRAAEWLADAVARPLCDGGGLTAALKRYRRTYRMQLGPAFLATASYSVARPMLPPERLIMRAATRDAALAGTLHGFGSGTVQAWSLFSPATLGRAAVVSMRRGPQRALPA